MSPRCRPGRSSPAFPRTSRRSCSRPSPRPPAIGSRAPTRWAPNCGGMWRTGRSDRGRSRPTSGSGVGAYGTPDWPRPARRRRRPRRIALAIVSSVAARNYSDQVQALKVEQQQTRKAERKARLELGNSLVTEGTALQRSGLVGQRFDSLDRLERAAQILGADPEGRHRLPEIRDHVIAGLGLVDLRVRFERTVGDVRSLCFDAALERYAFCEPSGDFVIRRLDDGHELLRLSIPGQRDHSTSCGAGFSPDGGLLVTLIGVPPRRRAPDADLGSGTPRAARGTGE